MYIWTRPFNAGSKFADFGGIVFELFYRVDLSVFG